MKAIREGGNSHPLLALEVDAAFVPTVSLQANVKNSPPAPTIALCFGNTRIAALFMVISYDAMMSNPVVGKNGQPGGFFPIHRFPEA